MVELVHADLTRDERSDVGRSGSSVDQALRALVIEQMNGFGYEELEPHRAGSSSYRAFRGFEEHDAPVERSTLQENIERITPETLVRVDRALMEYASARFYGAAVRGPDGPD
ncbi:transposase [Nannocystis exedens]|uniref:transposase n=1 Tax=Nannocystis exedens TaxID=54 RepID=UPI0014739FD8|nr:transposase [Nannocystis exedens]